MGNSFSSSSNSNKSAEKSFDNFYDIIDYIATYYILTMDFKSLSKLCEKEYCDKLVVITSDIIKRYFNDVEVTYLAQRVKDGLEVNDLTKENVIFVNKDQLETLDISNDAQKNLKKKRVCIGIAKFYIKIAHIFAAIVMTINPVYSYKDPTGQTIKTGLMEKDKIPKGINRQLYKFNICDNRIKALLKGQESKKDMVPGSDVELVSSKSVLEEPNLNGPELNGPELNGPNLNGPELNGPDLNGPDLNGPDLNGPDLNGSDLNGLDSNEQDLKGPPNPILTGRNQAVPNPIVAMGGANTIDDEITMQPKICDMNTNKDGTAKSLMDEPGIQELLQLYLDDKYDYSNGTFTGMSDETKKQFQNDLKTFYTTFTGNDVMPPEITKFSDIKLKDYSKLKGCQGDTPTLKNKYTINKNDKLFVEYAKNTQNMIQTAATNQSKLLDVINELFTYVIDPYTKKQKIRVNPKLTEESLQKSIEKTRKLIIALYVECEMGYVKGIKLYEAIVEAKILETTQKQINSLKKEASKIIDDTTKVVNKPNIPLNAAPLNAAPLNPPSLNDSPLNASPLNAAPLNPPSLNDSPLNASPLNAAPLNNTQNLEQNKYQPPPMEYFNR
jgi:hypothetical protein